jgi:23S rRNA (pseudouridine1915-N3)-methyltransferase
VLIKVIAVGTKMPAWVDQVSKDYSQRLPADIKLEWHEIKAEKRSDKKISVDEAERCMSKEAERIREALPKDAHLVALDEQGTAIDSVQLSQHLQRWRENAKPVVILIGGPDGLHAPLKEACTQKISLSKLTLPHPLVRIVLAEQLYRAWSILTHHPYHRA